MRWWDRLDRGCRGEPLDVFYESASVTDYATARALCVNCPVRAECLDDVMAVEAGGACYGFFGGMSSTERGHEARARKESGVLVRRGRKFAQCGTDSGYNRHLYLGEDACSRCLAAHAAAKAANLGRDAYASSTAGCGFDIVTIASRRDLYDDEVG